MECPSEMDQLHLAGRIDASIKIVHLQKEL